MIETLRRRFAARFCTGIGYVGFGISVAAYAALLYVLVEAGYTATNVAALFVPPSSSLATLRLPETGGVAAESSAGPAQLAPAEAARPAHRSPDMERAPRIAPPAASLKPPVVAVAAAKVESAKSRPAWKADASSLRIRADELQSRTSDVAREYVPVQLDVPYHAQGNLGGRRACSPTSLHMIMDYYHGLDAANRTIDDTEDLLRMMRATGRFSDYQGATAEQTAAQARDLGYAGSLMFRQWSRADLVASLQMGRPLIAVVGLGFSAAGRPHSVVVTGISADGALVRVNDPWYPDIRQVSWAAFDASWSAFPGCERHGIVVAP